MLANQTGQISQVISIGAPYIIDGASVVVTNPIGNISTVNAIGNFPSSDCDNQTVVALFTPTLGGKHTYVWTISTSIGTLTYIGSFVTTWSDSFDTVRDLLGYTVKDLSDLQVSRYYWNIATHIFQVYNGLPTYPMLAAQYQGSFDSGVAFLTAAMMRPTLPKKESIGELTSFGRGGTRYGWTNVGNNRMTKTPESTWEKAGWDALVTIPVIGTRHNRLLQQQVSILPSRGRVLRVDELGGIPFEQFIYPWGAQVTPLILEADGMIDYDGDGQGEDIW